MDFKFLFQLIGVFFILWLLGGGLDRIENKNNPFIKPIEFNEQSDVYSLDEASDTELVTAVADTNVKLPNSPFNTNTSSSEESESGFTETQINQTGSPYNGWKFVSANNQFAIALPQGWYAIAKPKLGDNARGEFSNGKIDITYEYGKSTNELAYEKTGTHEIVYGKIDGKNAKFVRPVNSFANTTGAYIKRSWGSDLTIVTNDELSPTEEDLVFAIIQTIQF